jgi:glutathione S-transferase
MRARMALWCAGVQVDLVEISLRDKPAAMLKVSPKGTVPVLHCADDLVLEESLAIMRWALGQHDPQGWLLQADQPDQTLNTGLIAINMPSAIQSLVPSITASRRSLV